MSEALRPLYLYWVEARGEKLMPSRADIDPVSIPRELLPNIVLVDVLSEPMRFRYRVMGTAVARMLGDDWTGRFVDEIPNIQGSVQRQYAQTATIGTPTVNLNEYDRYDPSLMQHKMVRYERLLLPLAERGGPVNMLFGGTIERTHTR